MANAKPSTARPPTPPILPPINKRSPKVFRFSSLRVIAEPLDATMVLQSPLMASASTLSLRRRTTSPLAAPISAILLPVPTSITGIPPTAPLLGRRFLTFPKSPGTIPAPVHWYPLTSATARPTVPPACVTIHSWAHCSKARSPVAAAQASALRAVHRLAASSAVRAPVGRSLPGKPFLVIPTTASVIRLTFRYLPRTVSGAITTCSAGQTQRTAAHPVAAIPARGLALAALPSPRRSWRASRR